MNNALIFSLVCAGIAILYGLWLIRRVLARPSGDEKMREIAKAIQVGAKAYLNRQYRTIAVVGIIVFILLWLAIGATVAIGFLVGAVFSGLTGYIGMNVSVRANVRTTEAAKGGLAQALRVAVDGGTVTGLLVVGLGLLGVAGLFAATGDINALIGLGFGGSLISIFARLGGGRLPGGGWGRATCVYGLVPWRWLQQSTALDVPWLRQGLSGDASLFVSLCFSVCVCLARCVHCTVVALCCICGCRCSAQSFSVSIGRLPYVCRYLCADIVLCLCLALSLPVCRSVVQCSVASRFV